MYVYAENVFGVQAIQRISWRHINFPVCDETVIDKELETRMELAQKVSSMGLALRKKINIIVKQPLQKLMIPVDALMKERLESVKSLIMNEVNVKEIDFVEGTSNLLVKKVKCNFKILGKKFGSLMKQVAAAVTAMNQEQISVLENEGKIVLDLNGTPAEIETSEVEIFSEDIPGWVVANEGVLTVALDTVVTEELRREGIARELVSKIQNIRKGSGFEITDKIKVSLSKNEQTDSAVKEYNTYICNQVLANSLNLVDEVKDGIELSFDDFSLYVSVISSIMNKDGNDTDDTSPTYKVLEEGANTLSKEETTRLAARQLKFIQGLQAALIRIENKTYGICRETGKLIPKERLRAVPHATLSIEAKNEGKK